MYKKTLSKIEEGISLLFKSFKKEAQGTKKAILIVQKYVKQGSITPEEELTLKKQISDSLKMVGVLIPLVLIPGSTILIPIILKVAAKYKIQLLPSSFYKEKKDEI